MPNSFDLISKDKYLQEHWIRRLVAFIIDIIIIWIIVWVMTIFLIALFFIFHGFGWWFFWFFFTGSIYILYSAFLEGTRGATIGKSVVQLRVVNRHGRMNISKGFLRNISKIFWPFLFLDVLLALISYGDPKQRYLDRIANTTVDGYYPRINNYNQRDYQRRNGDYNRGNDYRQSNEPHQSQQRTLGDFGQNK